MRALCSNLKEDEDAFKCIMAAIERSAYTPLDFMLAQMQLFADWFNAEDGKYYLPKSKSFNPRGNEAVWKDFTEKYPLFHWKTAWLRMTGKGGSCSPMSWARRCSLLATTSLSRMSKECVYY